MKRLYRAAALIALLCLTALPGLCDARLRFTGDVMVSESQLYAAAGFAGVFDFAPCFDGTRDILSDADATFANLETTVGKYKNMNYSGYPQFNTPDSILDALRDAGVDCLTLCNNHMLDRWLDGLKTTVKCVRERGFAYTGAYPEKEDRLTPVLYEVNGITLGLVAYTTSTNTMENYCDRAVKDYAVPYFATADIAGDVKRAREAGAQCVICFAHWGDEYLRAPDSNQKYYAQKLFDAGADIVIGSHSHMAQPMEWITGTDADGNARSMFVIWSMGNFVSSQTKRYTDSSLVLELTLGVDENGRAQIRDIGYIPLYCRRFGGGDEWLCVPVASGRYLDAGADDMTDAEWKRVKEAFAEIDEMYAGTAKRIDVG